MRRYETLIVLHPELPDAQMRETIDRTRKLIESMGGATQQIQEWGMRELAYPIRKQKRGYYVLAEYAANPDVVNELDRTLKIADEILRFVTVAAAQRKSAKESSKRPARRRATGGNEPSSAGEGTEAADEQPAAE